MTREDEAELEARAAVAARNPKRWVRFKNIDWLAVQLQVARGRKVKDVSEAMDVGLISLSARMKREKWRLLPAAELKAMSEDVIRTGRARAEYLGASVDELALASAAAWTPVDPNAPIWPPKRINTTTDSTETDDENEASHDFARAECDRVFLALDRELRRLGFDPGAEGLPDPVSPGDAEAR